MTDSLETGNSGIEPAPAAQAGTPEPARPAFREATGGPASRQRERRRRFMHRVRHVLAAAAVVAVLALTALAVRPRPVPVDAVQVSRGSLVVAIEETGVTRVKDRYVVSAPVAGTVSRQILEPGDAVKEGDVLAEIAPVLAPLLDERTRSEAQATLSAALSGLGQAQAQEERARVAKELAAGELARSRALARGGSLTQQNLERAEFDARIRAEELSSAVFAVKVASEQVRIARATLAGEGRGASRDRHIDVLAPASGRVLRVLQKSAGVLQAGAPLLEVGDPQALEMVVDLLTTDAVQVQPGTPVTVQGWGGDRALAARVRRIEPSAFTKLSALGVEEQRVNVIAVFTDPHEAWSALGDAFRIEARLVLWQGEGVAKIPQGAAFRHGDGWAAFRIDSGKSRLVPVRIGHRGESEVEVLEGLEPGTLVAVHPGDRVKEGARVEVR
ncbi:MAG TPA: HlyD family efflux transporter periplasmic adaptor subunit [Myxococcales bacterium]|nr:HlyD family efflux transporter periplasmic adaptor subunit [Myxococcales bacterium]